MKNSLARAPRAAVPHPPAVRAARRGPVTAVVLVAALALAGCAAAAPTPSTPAADGIELPADIAEKGYLDVGAYFNYPPYTVPQGDSIVGIEPELLALVAEKLGVELRYHDLAFEAVIPSVANGRVDMLVGPYADLPERHGEVMFVDTLTVTLQALVAEGNPTGFDIAQPCGTNGGEIPGSINGLTVQALSEQCTADGESAIDVLGLPDNAAVFQAVTSGRTDFTLQESALATFMAQTTTGLELQGDPIPGVSGELQGWVVDKDNEPLARALVEAIRLAIEDGTWGEVMAAAGLESSMLPEPLVNSEQPSF